jgi:hypothetical protein
MLVGLLLGTVFGAVWGGWAAWFFTSLETALAPAGAESRKAPAAKDGTDAAAQQPPPKAAQQPPVPPVNPPPGTQPPAQPPAKPPASQPPATRPGNAITQADRDAIAKWIDENEGDPNVQMISLDGPRRRGENRIFLAKYRCKNVFGGLSVQLMALGIGSDGATSTILGLTPEHYADFFSQLPDWDGLNTDDRRSDFQKAFTERMNEPITSKPP